VVLKECWGLITSGTDRKHIKICGNKLLVNNQIYGEIINSNTKLKLLLVATLQLMLIDPHLPPSDYLSITPIQEAMLINYKNSNR